MHRSVQQFIREVKAEFPYKFRLRKVLEVGSANINGSPRSFFWFCDYTGVDISKGKGVDVVGRFCEIELPKESYQVVLSCECLEHDSTWQQSLKKMYELLLPGGLLIITCAACERPEHGTFRTSPECSPDTIDYYRNLSKPKFRSVLPPELFTEYVLQYARGQNDLQFYGLKIGSSKRNLLKALLC